MKAKASHVRFAENRTPRRSPCRSIKWIRMADRTSIARIAVADVPAQTDVRIKRRATKSQSRTRVRNVTSPSRRKSNCSDTCAFTSVPRSSKMRTSSVFSVTYAARPFDRTPVWCFTWERIRVTNRTFASTAAAVSHPIRIASIMRERTPATDLSSVNTAVRRLPSRALSKHTSLHILVRRITIVKPAASRSGGSSISRSTDSRIQARNRTLARSAAPRTVIPAVCLYTRRNVRRNTTRIRRGQCKIYSRLPTTSLNRLLMEFPRRCLPRLSLLSSPRCLRVIWTSFRTTLWTRRRVKDT